MSDTWVTSTVDENGVATMGWNINPGSWSWWKRIFWQPISGVMDVVIPDFGFFGGPGYLSGHLWDSDNKCIDDPNIEIEDLMAIWDTLPVALNSSGNYSLSDTAFKAHDKAYYDAWKANQEDSTINEAGLKLVADKDLLQALYNVFTNSNYTMDKVEIAYDLLAAKAFLAQIMLYDPLMAGAEEIMDTAQKLFKYITKISGTYTVDHLTHPTNPTTNYTITGDLTPIDFDPDTEGIQTQKDEWGNIKTDSNLPSPGRADILYDTSANDRIEAGGGDDFVDCENGGDNWILGGDGCDFFDGESSNNCIIEGGAGSDIIFGSYGEASTDKLFAESYGDMSALIAAGETAPSTNARGDLIESIAGGGNEIYGSNGNDILMAGGGKDLIVGGGGDDLIIGDECGVVYANFSDRYTWGFSIDVSTDANGNTTYTYYVTGIQEYSPAQTAGNDDVIYAGTGNDFVSAGGGDDEVYGGLGSDTVFGDAGNDFIEGGDGNDVLIGDNASLSTSLQGDDYIDGGAGNDSIWGDAGNDELFGGADNDTIYGGDGDDYIDGEAGLNLLNGGSGNDVIFGDVDNDTLYGDDGDDYLDGQAGLNSLYGGAGNDTIFGGDDADLMEGDYSDSTQGNDYLDGLGGNDTIIGAGGSDTIYGGEGNDQLHGDASNIAEADLGDDYIDGEGGDDIILGYGGNDTLDGGDGNDWLQGDAGNDTLAGGAGSDTYFYKEGDGSDTITDNAAEGEVNVLIFGDGITFNIIELNVGSLDILIGNNGDVIHFDNFDPNDAYGTHAIDKFEFADGTEATYSQLIDKGFDITGTSGDDQLGGTNAVDRINGLEGNDTLIGGAGNDILTGGAGNDTYIFGRGDGSDTIVNYADDYATAINTVQFGYDITSADLTFAAAGNDLRIYVAGTSDSFTIRNWFSGEAYRPDQFVFADTTIMTPEQIDPLVIYPIYGTAGNDSITGGAGADVMIGGKGDDIYVVNNTGDVVIENVNEGTDTVQSSIAYTLAANVEYLSLTGNDAINGFGNELNNTITGNDGDNILSGGAGNDTIYGDTTIYTMYGGAGNDVLDGGAGNDYLLGNNGDDTYIFGVGSGSDTIDNHAYDWSHNYPDDAVRFGEGITLADLDVSKDGYDLLINIHGTTDTLRIYSYFYSGWYEIGRYEFAGGTVLSQNQFEAAKLHFTYYGTDNNDNISGTYDSYASDTIYGYAGNDTLWGGYGGNDALYGGAGNDILSVSGSSNNSTLDGGAGNDSLTGSEGDNDTYVFGRGYGQDTITYEYDNYFSDVDTIFLDSSIQKTDVAFTYSYNGLIISLAGSSDTLTVRSWFADTNSIEYIKFSDGTTWDYGTVNQMLSQQTDGADRLFGSNNADALSGLGGNDMIYGYRGDDTIGGGLDDDYIDGGAGNVIQMSDKFKYRDARRWGLQNENLRRAA